MELIWITQAKYKEGFKIYLKFNNGMDGLVDLEEELNGRIYEPLRDPHFFQKFQLNQWTLEWPNGADFAPEFLYEIAVKNNVQKIEN